MRQFCSAKGGNVAIIFALTFSATMMLAGFAVDFQRGSSIKHRLQEMADQASLAGVGKNVVFDGVNYSYDATKAKAAAQGLFEANLSKANFGEGVTVTPSYAATVTGASVSTTVSFTAQVNTVMAGMFGVNQVTISGASTSKSATPNYVDVVIVVDTSSSMLMGASDADQVLMIQKTGCYLACHGSEATLHGYGVVTRVDVVAAALGNMIDELKKNSMVDQQYRVAIYGFSAHGYQIFAPSTDLTAAKTAALGIQAQTEGTNATQSLKEIKESIPVGGTGSDINHRQQFMLLFTDGTTNDVKNKYDPNGSSGDFISNPQFTWFAPTQASGWHTQGFNPSDCNQIKQDRNTSVMTLNTIYVVRPDETDGRTLFIKDQLLDKIQANLRSCASEADFAFVANDGAQITAATKSLTEALLSTAHLTH